jgi:hypothetical protein
MAHWLRFSTAGKEYFGTLEGDHLTAWRGDMFAEPRPTTACTSHWLTCAH